MVYTRTPHTGRDLNFFSSLGIGSITQEIDKAFGSSYTSNYPPYNINKVSDEHYVLEFAVAGFNQYGIDISVEKDVLTVKGERNEDEKANYVYKGIAGRKFTRSFSLPEYFEVDKASMIDGILYIDLYKNVPEEKKPKKIEIK
jgi:molecular chaperone IbpA